MVGSNLCVKRSGYGGPTGLRLMPRLSVTQFVAVVHLRMEDHPCVGGMKCKKFLGALIYDIIYDLYDLFVPPGTARLSITQKKASFIY